MMMRQRADQERAEAKTLAPYALLSANSRGRRHEEEPHPRRTEFQRDRQRIVHSRAFRRLEYKTQVFLNHAGDHYRTRLTHTIEVASIARGLARTLGLNEDLAEAISLAHDLGHPPFGHAGEETLNKLMASHGGFDHNAHSQRIVEELELKYPEFNGLNLTLEVLDGLSKPAKFGSMEGSEPSGRSVTHQSLEAQVADIADEIAYICHDLDDARQAGLISDQELAEVALWSRVQKGALASYRRLDPERAGGYVLRCLLDLLVEDVIAASSEALEKASPTTPEEARRASLRLIRHSETTRHESREMYAFLLARFYHHPTIREANEKSCQCLEHLFELLVRHPHLLSPQFLLRVKKEGVPRAVCDYLACMTDRYALQQHARLIGSDSVQIPAAQPALFE